MSIRILATASIFVLGVGCYALFGTRAVNPVTQNEKIIELQRDMLTQLELQTVVLTHIRDDSLNEHE